MSTPTKYEGHTPGPLVAKKWSGSNTGWHVVDAENNLVTGIGKHLSEADANLYADAPELLAENTRLREALHKIAYEPFGPADASFQAVLDSVIGCAQQALAAGKGTSPDLSADPAAYDRIADRELGPAAGKGE